MYPNLCINQFLNEFKYKDPSDLKYKETLFIPQNLDFEVVNVEDSKGNTPLSLASKKLKTEIENYTQFPMKTVL